MLTMDVDCNEVVIMRREGLEVVVMENQVLEVIRKRRSIRRYRPEQINDDELAQIIEAGRLAPSGGNNQTNHFVVIQNEEVLNQLKELAAAEFSKMKVTEDTYKSLKSAILLSKKGSYDFTYHAPTFVVVANKRGYGNAMADCAVALENMMIAATSINIGSCWVNQLKWLTDNDSIKKYMESLGVDKDEIICGGLVLGYFDQKELAPPESKGNQVTYIK
jgi:nitroreductase